MTMLLAVLLAVFRFTGFFTEPRLNSALRMNWISAGEFQEIGEGRRGSPCVSGQAILSRSAIDTAVVLRFDDQATLKWKLNPAQPRRGARIALRASIGGMTIYNLHLESGSNEERRGLQVNEVVKDARAMRAPIVVGGDFNNAGRSDSFMFDGLTAAGFTNTMNLDRQIARRPIDWIFTKDLKGTAAPVRAPDVSDHDPVVLCAETTHAFLR
jgi:endonuclease/exonuclease/phosphatase family metal-dependent hydrolase